MKKACGPRTLNPVARHTPCPLVRGGLDRFLPKRLASVLLSVSLIACAPALSVRTAIQPGLPTAYPVYQDFTAERHGENHGDSLGSFLQSAPMQQVIGDVLKGSHDLKGAWLKVREARAALGISQADRLPSIAAGLNASRTSLPADLSPMGRHLISQQFQANIGFASWEIDLWGRIASLNEAALASYLAAQATREAVELSLITQAAHTYLALCESAERLTLAEQTLASRAESLRIFQRREALGAISRLELIQVDLLWQQAQVLVSQLKQNQATSQHALSLLVGHAGYATPQCPTLSAVRPSGFEGTPVPSELLQQRPDIRAAEHALRAAGANVKVARAAFWPRIALTTSAGTASTDLERLFERGSGAWTFAPSISLPLFDAGRLRNSLDLASIREELAVNQYEKTVQAAYRDVVDALAARAYLAEQALALQTSLKLQEERVKLANLRYQHGAVRYLELLDAERERLSVEQALVSIRRAELSAGVSLFAALGGSGFNATSTPSLQP